MNSATTASRSGRPYRFRTGDQIQLRQTVHPVRHEPLRNGSTATITTIDQTAQTARLQLADGREVELDGDQLDQAHARLAYVQHPFPAHGITTDTAHLIVGEHVSREGTYVAITRARERTDIHAATGQLDPRRQHRPGDWARRAPRS